MSILDRIRQMSFKASSVTRLIATAAGPGQPVYTPRRFADLAKEGYNQNVYVFRACLTIAQAGASVPWKLYKLGNKKQEIDKHPLLDLMKKPNAEEGGARFWKKVILFYYLSGNSYIELMTDSTGQGLQLYTLRPDRMNVVPDTVRGVGGYIYTVGGKAQSIDADKVLHWHTFDPLNDWYGISPIVVASRIIDQMNSANDWNTALFQNMARPSGIFTTDTVLGTTDREDLRAEIKRLYSRAQNAGKPVMLDGGLKFQQTSTNPVDLDFLGGKTQNGREIAIAIGVAPELLGDSANKTYSNIQEARKALYSEAVLPALYELRDDLNNTIVPLFDSTLSLDIDESGIEALQEDQDTKRRWAKEAWSVGLVTQNEARKIAGLDETPEGDVYFVPSGGKIVPADQLDEPPPEPSNRMIAPGTSTIMPLPPGTAKPLALPAPSAQPQPVQPPPAKRRKALNMRDEESKSAHYKAVNDQRDRWIDAVQKQAADVLDEMRKSVKKLADGSLTHHALDLRLDATMHAARVDVSDLLKTIYVTVGGDFAKTTKRDLLSSKRRRKDESDDEFDDAILFWLKTYSSTKVTSITDTVRDQVRTALAAGVDAGESIGEIGSRIDDLFLEQIIPNRSQVIAQTEVIGASNLGSRFGAQNTGLDLTHEWLATRDGRTREAHQDADGQTVPLDEPFLVDGEELLFPGDPNGSAANDINCRCTEIYHEA